MSHDLSPRTEEAAPRGYEQRDVQTRAVMWLFGGVAAAVLIAVAGVGLGVRWLENEARQLDPAISPLAAEPPQSPAPRLQATPLADYQAFRAREEQHLASYGWIDRERQIAHIPIDRAIALLVERGEPQIEPQQTRPDVQTPPTPRR